MRAAGWTTTFSIGAIAMETPPETVDEMICRADDLMYEVKKAGKNALRVETALAPPTMER